MAIKHFFFKTWWLLLVFGAALIALGFISILDPFSTFIKLISYAGVVLFLDGILLVLLSGVVANNTEKNALIAESAINFFFALLLCFNPLFTVIILPLVMGSWLIGIGIVKLVASIAIGKRLHGWLFINVAGIAALFFGFLIIYNPAGKAASMLTLSGAFWLLMGMFYIVDALRFKSAAIALSILV